MTQDTVTRHTGTNSVMHEFTAKVSAQVKTTEKWTPLFCASYNVSNRSELGWRRQIGLLKGHSINFYM